MTWTPASSIPATLAQGQKLLSLVKDVPSKQVQNLLENGDLLLALAKADGSRIDRAAFNALLAPVPEAIDWTPVSQYADKLRDWNNRFSLGLSDEQIDGLILPDHAGPHQPTSITLTLGKGLQHDRKVVRQILKYELNKIGVAFTDYSEDAPTSYFPGSEPADSKQPSLGTALLDIGRFWDSKNGVAPRAVREQFRGQPLPALEVAWLLALNPQVYAAMDGKTVPFMWAPGLVIRSGGVACFGRGAVGAFVRGHRGGNQWGGDSVVVFRGVRN